MFFNLECIINRRMKRLLCLCPILWITSCGEMTLQPGGGNQGQNTNSQNRYILSGDWSGIFKTFKTEGSDPKETKANVKIEPSGDLIGNFSLDLPSYDQVLVKGTYRDFANKSLMIDIITSNFSILGLTGSKIDLPYILAGDALEFNTDRFTLKLTKKNSGSESNKISINQDKLPKNSQENGIFGYWICEDKSRFLWNLKIKDNGSFSIDIVDKNKIEASIWMDGTIELSNRNNLQIAKLLVLSSDIQKNIGKIFLLELKEKGVSNLSKIDQTTDQFGCILRS